MNVFPVFLGGYDIAEMLASHWAEQLVLCNDFARSVAYLITGPQTEHEFAAALLAKRLPELSDRPVVWVLDAQTIRFYDGVADFGACVIGRRPAESSLSQPVYTAVYWPDWSGEDGDNHGHPFGIQMDDVDGNNLDMHWYRLEADRDAALDALRAPLGGHEHEVVIDIDADGHPTYSVPASVRVRVFERSLEEPATFLYTADGDVERQPMLIEDDDEADGDVCDNCMLSGVAVSQTCPCGRTLCADCAEENDGLCSDCAAEDAESDEDEDEADDDEVGE